jgi:hypothetical protein
LCSFLRHSGLAETSEEGDFEQGTDLRFPEITRHCGEKTDGFQADDARETIVANEPSSLCQRRVRFRHSRHTRKPRWRERSCGSAWNKPFACRSGVPIARRLTAYNSCHNRHCPKLSGGGGPDWLAAREADLLPVGYFHVVFTLRGEIAPIAYQNKTVVYDLLFRTAARTLLTIAADPKHLGARVGATAVLHSWGSAMTHHPHVHMIVPGGGISLDGTRWVRCKPGFLLPVRVLSRLFRRLFLTALADAHAAGRLAFFGEIADLCRHEAFAAHLAPLRQKNWFVYAKPPFAGPEAVLAYLARYTHRVAIANSRLMMLDERGVTFRYKDYRRNGQARYRTMTLAADEFIRRFLLHILPKGFHRIRHYGLLASPGSKANIARARELIAAPMPAVDPLAAHDSTDPDAATDHRPPCPCCGGRLIIVEVFGRGGAPRGPPSRAKSLI